MNKNLFVVLMAGGVGVRFWPYSRNSKPKQFLDVLGTGKTLLTIHHSIGSCPFVLLKTFMLSRTMSMPT